MEKRIVLIRVEKKAALFYANHERRYTCKSNSNPGAEMSGCTFTDSRSSSQDRPARSENSEQTSIGTETGSSLHGKISVILLQFSYRRRVTTKTALGLS